MARKIHLIILILINIGVLTAGIIFIHNDPVNKIKPTSFLISDSDISLTHYQVNKYGVKIVWRGIYNNTYFNRIKIDDLDNDGRLDVIAFASNTGIARIDFETGKLIWYHRIVATNTLKFHIKIGDITGDGNKEIIVGQLSVGVEPDLGIQIYNKDGDLIQVITHSGINLAGPDNIELVDFNGDNKYELLALYGNAYWNSSSRTGGYELRYMEWQNNQMVDIWKKTGYDRGGDTVIAVYRDGKNNLIVTAGWYNDEIRVFDVDGNLIWEKQAYPTDNNTIIELADPNIYVEQTDKGPILNYLQSNYWYNFTLGWYQFDLYSGKQINVKYFDENTRTLKGELTGKYLVMKRASKEIVDNQERYVLRYELYNSETQSLIGEYRDNRNRPWIGNPQIMPVLINSSDLPAIILLDFENRYWLSTINYNIKLSDISLGNYALITVKENVNYFDGITMIKYPNIALYLILIIFLINILFIVFNQLLSEYNRRKFDRNFGVYWKYVLYQKLVKILSEKENLQLPESFEITTDPSTQHKYQKLSDIRLDIIKPKENHIFYKFLNEWIEKHGQQVSKISAGEIAILIDFLDASPDPLSAKDLTELYQKKFFPRSTLYEKIKFLKKLELIEQVPTTSANTKNKYYSITMNGVEFLKSAFSSLNFYFGN